MIKISSVNLIMGSLIVLSVLSVALALTFGAAPIHYQDLWQCLSQQCPSKLESLIVWQLRVPRIIIGYTAGMGLACAGALLQNTTRNPLADPYLFGIVAGAGLGVTIASLLIGVLSYISLPLAAFLGALLAVVLVLMLTNIAQRVEHLLLGGVAISFMLSAISQFFLYLGEPMASNRVIFWLMGSLAHVELSQSYLVMSVVVLVYVAIFAIHRQIDAFALGDEHAATLGINIQRIKQTVFILCAALTAVIVAYCGGIAFVGLMIPHMARFLFGSRTLRLTLASGLLGGCFLVWVDVLARTAINGLEIPIGIITSALGSIFFLTLLYRNQRTYHAD